MRNHLSLANVGHHREAIFCVTALVRTIEVVQELHSGCHYNAGLHDGVTGTLIDQCIVCSSYNELSQCELKLSMVYSVCLI